MIKPFDDRNSPRDHVITALVTLGEGYHNFHHEVSNHSCPSLYLIFNSPKVSFGLPERHRVVAVRPNQMVHLGMEADRPSL